jgi:hypothetical protein
MLPWRQPIDVACMRFFPSLVTLEAVSVAYKFGVLGDLDCYLGCDWDLPPTLEAERVWFLFKFAGASHDSHPALTSPVNLLPGRLSITTGDLVPAFFLNASSPSFLPTSPFL